MRSFVLLSEYFLISLSGFCLLIFGVIDGGYKIHVLSATFVVSLFPISFRLFYSNEWGWEELGFRLDNIKQWWRLYFKVTVLGILVLVIYSYIFQTYAPVSQRTLLFYSFWGAIAQELLYRAYLMKLGQEVFGNGKLNIAVNIVVFVGMHSFYSDFLQKLWILVPAGFIFTMLYREKPNIILVCISHIILNFTAVSLGIFH